MEAVVANDGEFLFEVLLRVTKPRCYRIRWLALLKASKNTGSVACKVALLFLCALLCVKVYMI